MGLYATERKTGGYLFNSTAGTTCLNFAGLLYYSEMLAALAVTLYHECSWGGWGGGAKCRPLGKIGFNNVDSPTS